MNRFLVKTSIFLLPIVLIHLLTYLFYTIDQGDLLRIGYVWDGLPKTKLIMDKHMQGKRNFARVSADKLDKKYTVLTIGDSFSELDSFGYQNYLGEHKDLQILHVDQRIHNNDPLQGFSNLLNGDFFDSLNIQFVVLQSVERYITGRGLNLDTSKKMTVSSLDSLAQKVSARKNIEDKYKFFSNRVLKFTSLNFLYLFDNNTYYLKNNCFREAGMLSLLNKDVYKIKLNDNYFSSSKKELLFVYDDLNGVKMNNELNNVVNLNNVLNDFSRKLNKKGIQLIFLPAPDKYDFYYEQLVNKNKYPKPLFFEHFNTLKKEYLFIDSKKILADSIHSTKDIYQYGDTHWSPNSSKFISKELYKVIKANR